MSYRCAVKSPVNINTKISSTSCQKVRQSQLCTCLSMCLPVKTHYCKDSKKSKYIWCTHFIHKWYYLRINATITAYTLTFMCLRCHSIATVLSTPSWRSLPECIYPSYNLLIISKDWNLFYFSFAEQLSYVDLNIPKMLPQRYMYV